MKNRTLVVAAIAVLGIAMPAARSAPAAPKAAPATGAPAPAAPAAVKPAESPMRTVEALGTALVTGGDLAAARRQAIYQGLRAAVEQVTGVYVSASVQTRNYIVAEDKVTARAAGFAMLDQVLDERVDGGIYKVAIRATVSTGPLAARLGGLGPFRQWRVAVLMPASPMARLGCPRTEESAVEEALGQRLADADFLITDWRRAAPPTTEAEVARLLRAGPEELAAWGRRRGADVVVAGGVTVQLDRVVPITSDWLKFDYVHCRADVTLRAVRTDTGEVLSTHVLNGTDEGTSRLAAVRALLGRLGRRSGERLMEPLLRLPGAASATVRVSVSGFDRAFEARRFQDVLAKLPGVRRVRFLDYTHGRTTLDVTLPAERTDLLAALFEEPAILGGFRLQVVNQTRERLLARLAEEP